MKHRPGGHDHNQLDHAPRGRGVGLSSLDKGLRHKKIGGQTVLRVYKDARRPKERLVLFDDGRQTWFPAPVLAKIVYMGGEREPIFKTLAEARAKGFVSILQADYLNREMPDVFERIVRDAAGGRRFWDARRGKMVIER